MAAVLRVTLDGVGNHVSEWRTDQLAYAQLLVTANKYGMESIITGADPDKGMICKSGVPVGNWQINEAA